MKKKVKGKRIRSSSSASKMNGPRREHLCAGSRNLCPDIFSSEMDAAPPQALTSYQLRSQREGGFTLIVSRYSALLQSSPSRRQTRLLCIRFRVALLDIRIAVGATGLLSTTQTASFYKCEHLHSLGGGRSHTKEGTAGAIGAPKSGTCVSLCGFEWTPVSVSVSR